jgi:hypothetical protein
MGFVHALTGWVADHPFVAAAIAIGSFAASVIVTIVVLVRLPADYFVGDRSKPWFTSRSAPVRVLLHVARNLLGVLLIVLGVLMSLPGVPGQGILTILLGIMLADVPGKRRLERWLVTRKVVRRAIDKIRVRRGRPPLVVDDDRAGAVRTA